jgi:hypothetical protein
MIGANTGEDGGDESVGPNDGDEGGEEESAKGVPRAIIACNFDVQVQIVVAQSRAKGNYFM